VLSRKVSFLLKFSYVYKGRDEKLFEIQDAENSKYTFCCLFVIKTHASYTKKSIYKEGSKLKLDLY
jgi:hypothetical protein